MTQGFPISGAGAKLQAAVGFTLYFKARPLIGLLTQTSEQSGSVIDT